MKHRMKVDVITQKKGLFGTRDVYHLARTCGNVTTAACFMQFAKQAR